MYSMMLGQCLVYNDNGVGIDGRNKPRKVIPLEDENTQEPDTGHMNGRDGWSNKNDYRYGNIFAELGMSLHQDSVNQKILFGAPGTWNWTGTAIV